MSILPDRLGSKHNTNKKILTNTAKVHVYCWGEVLYLDCYGMCAIDKIRLLGDNIMMTSWTSQQIYEGCFSENDV